MRTEATEVVAIVPIRAPVPTTIAVTPPTAVRRRKRRRSGPDAPSPAVPGARHRRSAAIDIVRKTQPAIVPASEGRADNGVAPVRVRAAASPAAPATANTATPARRRRRSRRPAAAAASSTPTPRVSRRKSLSFAPKRSIASSLAHCGTMSMTNEPDASSGLASRAAAKAVISATATNTAPLTTPASAAQPRPP